MTNDPQLVQELFLAALQIPEADRTQWLAEQCADNLQVKRRVEILLEAHDATQGFGAQGSIPTSPILDTPELVNAGALLAGRYKLLETIGEGGMGTVWLAEQIEPVRRKVAIKLVKAGMDSKQVLARFEAERQALALMDHPNIAKVLDGGITSEGRPFFVMEYVKGIPLTEYCDKHQLTLRERLELLVPICHAIQHAHQKGIIHRDLKPSNVLICLYDGLPIPRVIDFGLAKAMHQPLTERTHFTGHGLVLGTPLYMSPEQAELNNLDVDTRSDVYSLGVLLYELLTGSTPLEKAQFQAAALTEILRIIKEVDPPKPSTRVSSSATLPSIAAQRKLDPSLLSKAIVGDLDWIVMKALDKDRSRRYETANALARDIQRFLACEPVEACPPSPAYRLKKYYAKNRTAILTASGFVVLLAASALVSGWQAYRATRSERSAIAAKQAEQQQRTRAEQQRDEAKKLEDEAVIRSAELQKLTETQRRELYASDMNLVRIEADRGNLARMLELLNQQLPIDGRQDLRGPEWSYWYNYLNQGKSVRLVSNYTTVNAEPRNIADLIVAQSRSETLSAAILPKGDFAAFSMGNETRIMRIDSGEEVQRIPVGLTGLVNRTRFSANARAVFAPANSISAFDSSSAPISTNVASGISVYQPGRDPIRVSYPENTFSHISQVTISRDGKFVAAIGNALDHRPTEPSVQAIVWDIDNRRIVFQQNEKREFNRVELNDNATGIILYVAHGSSKHEDRTRVVASVWNVRQAKEVQSIQYDDDIDSATWHPTQPIVYLTTLGFSGNNTKQLLRWSVVDHKLERLSNEVMPNFVRVEIRPDGRELAISSHGSESIRLIDTTTGNLNRTLYHPESQVESIGYKPDGEELVASTSQGHIISWKLGHGLDQFGLRKTAILPAATIRDWSFDRAFMRAAFCTTDGRVVVRDRSGHEFSVDAGLVDGFASRTRMVYSNDGHHLAVWFAGFKQRNPLILIDCQSGKILWRKELATPEPVARCSAAFSPDQTKLIVTNEQQLRTLDVKTGSETPVSDDKRVYGELCYDSTGERLLVGALSTMVTPSLQIVDAMRGDVLFEMPVPRSSEVELKVSQLIPSRCGKYLVAITPSQLTVWNLKLQKAIHETEGVFIPLSTSSTSGFQFSADGKLAVVPVYEVAVRRVTSTSLFARIKRVDILDLAMASLVSSISFLGDDADDVKLSPDGKRLLSLHGKNPSGALEAAAKAKLWDLQSTRELLTLPLPRFNKSTWDMFYEPEHSAIIGLSFNVPFATRPTGESVVFDTRPLSPEADNALFARRLVDELSKGNNLAEDIQRAITQHPHVHDDIKALATQLASRLTVDSDTLASECMAELSLPGTSRAGLEQALSKAKTLHQREPSSLRSIALLSAFQFLLDDVDGARTLATSVRSDASEDIIYEVLRRAIEALCLEDTSDAIVHHKRLIAIADRIASIRMQGDRRMPAVALVLKLFHRQGMELTKALLEDRPLVRTRKPSTSSENKANVPVNLWEPVRQAMAKIDKNGNGQVSEDELPTRTLSDWHEFDIDRSQTLDIAEFSTWQFVTSVLAKSKVDSSKLAEFERKDIDHDAQWTTSDGVMLQMIQALDTDKSGGISKSEYEHFQLRGATLSQLLSGMKQLPTETKIHALEHFLKVYPEESNLLNAQAWVLATCPEDDLRDGQKALAAALESVKGNGASVPARLATLAAAYAETGDFKMAEETQSKVIELTNNQERYLRRLELYKAGKPYRDTGADASNSANATQPEKPIWSQQDLEAFRTIAGGEPCWSPDGAKLCYVLTTFGAEHSYFESMDLKSGQQAIVGRGGRNPRWSSGEIQWLAFDNSPREPLTSTDNRESKVWLQRIGSGEYQTVGTGECLGWDTQGKLYIRHFNTLLKVDPHQPAAASTIIEANLFACAVSQNGTQLAYSKFGKVTTCELSTSVDKLSGHIGIEDRGSLDWSPDGKHLLFGSCDPDRPGLWLIDAKTSKRTLLAKIICKPRWSPDGKQVALGLLSSNQILLIDREQLPPDNPLRTSAQ